MTKRCIKKLEEKLNAYNAFMQVIDSLPAERHETSSSDYAGSPLQRSSRAGETQEEPRNFKSILSALLFGNKTQTGDKKKKGVTIHDFEIVKPISKGAYG